MYDNGKIESVRNPEGIWINTNLFREQANNFIKNGYYTSAAWGSPDWIEYWREQRRRCIEGYKVGGAMITGDHYYYLNFSQIELVADVDTKKRVSKKIKTFPHFWDGDYNYFWAREIAKKGILSYYEDSPNTQYKIENFELKEKIKELVKIKEQLYLMVDIPEDYLEGGYNLIVGKSRRKGYSYKNSAIGAKNFFTKPNSHTIYVAYDKKYLYPNGIFTFVKNAINFVNQNTGWVTPSDTVDKANHKRASYITYQNGVKVEKGLFSEVEAISAKDNPNATRGIDAEDIFFEESGAFGTPGILKDLYKASKDTAEAGIFKTGMITIFGTSGDMDKGSIDYASLHGKPEANGFLPFINQWDDTKNTKTTVGFFHPVNWNMEGFYDENGNSDTEGAKEFELSQREKAIQKGATEEDIRGRMQEKPLGPREAFNTISLNTFPVVDLERQLLRVESEDLNKIHGIPVSFAKENNKVIAKPILSGKVTPISSYKESYRDIRGTPVIYEYPIPNAPKGLYKIGYDPIRQEQGTSLAGIIVYKSFMKGSYTKNNIVAEYIGRYSDPDEIDRLASLFAQFYNTQIMHENEVTSVKNYFRRNKTLHLLAHQPDAVISKNIKNSKVTRVYGCHMTSQLKDAGERYVKQWLLEVIDYDEEGNPVRNIDKIYSKRLLEELISYYRKGNFDLVSALFMCMFQVQEEELEKDYSAENKTSKKIKKLVNLSNIMYRK